jgi:hypothetical protein
MTEYTHKEYSTKTLIKGMTKNTNLYATRKGVGENGRVEICCSSRIKCWIEIIIYVGDVICLLGRIIGNTIDCLIYHNTDHMSLTRSKKLPDLKGVAIFLCG